MKVLLYRMHGHEPEVIRGLVAPLVASVHIAWLRLIGEPLRGTSSAGPG